MTRYTPAKRVYHPWWEWECHRAGFFSTCPLPNMNSESSRAAYRCFLSDLKLFEFAMIRVVTEWPRSCEHWLTNVGMNRVAWLGQASMCITTGVPAYFRGGYTQLSPEQQRGADSLAEQHLERWIHGFNTRARL